MRESFEYTLTCEPEDDGPEGYFASGDEDFDHETVEKIERASEWNEWAWCIARVTARHPEIPDLEGVAYLGGCNYESAADFKQGGYYEQMVDEAAADLEAAIARVVRAAVK